MKLKTVKFIDVCYEMEEEVGEKFTLVSFTEFGFPYTLQFKLKKIDVVRYAQYPHALELVFRKKQARTDRRMVFLPGQEILIWRGWVDPDVDMWKGGTERYGDVTVNTGLNSFDDKYLKIAKFSVGRLPDIEYFGGKSHD